MPPKSTKPKGAMRGWRITLLRAKVQYLGRVEAPDEATAIEEAIKQFNIDDAHRSRLIAQLVE